MKEKINNNKKLLIIFGIVLIFTSITELFAGIDLLVNAKPAVDIYEIDESEIVEGMHVISTIDTCFDSFYIEKTTNYTYGVETGSSEIGYGFILPMIVESDDAYYISKFIGLKTQNVNEKDTLDKLVDETYFWWFEDEEEPVTSIEINAKVVAMDDEEINIMEQYLRDIGYEDDEIKDKYIPYMLEVITPGIDAVTEIVGIAFLVLGIFLLRKGIMEGKAAEEDGKEIENESLQ